jgi:hypothetical protein
VLECGRVTDPYAGVKNIFVPSGLLGSSPQTQGSVTHGLHVLVLELHVLVLVLYLFVGSRKGKKVDALRARRALDHFGKFLGLPSGGSGCGADPWRATEKPVHLSWHMKIEQKSR